MVLFNESFCATNVREGSEIGRPIVTALLENRYELAHGWRQRNLENVMFLRADRRKDGVRTLELEEGQPLGTSYGEDLYRRIFGVEAVS